MPLFRSLALACAFVLAGCQPGAVAPTPEPTASAAPAKPARPVPWEAQVLAEGLELPWGIAFLPDGSALVTERPGRVRLLDASGKLAPAPIPGAPTDVAIGGQGGFLDVALHPRFAENQFVYFTYSVPGAKGGYALRIARARFDGSALTDRTPLYTTKSHRPLDLHFGGRMLFLPDETLLVTLGEGYEPREKAQDVNADLGKILRLRDDGAPPKDNPFADKKGVAAHVFTLGHRNPQGIARDPADGRLYATEYGPRGGDELNRIEAGGNYGWPIATHGVDYSGAVISPFKERRGMVSPLAHWTPSINPTGLSVYRGEAFPQWRGSALIGSLLGGVWRVTLTNGEAKDQERLFYPEVSERVRAVVPAADGTIYLLTDPGKIIRIAPRKD
jgi:glucose/arabinose dehydrogenase